MYYLQILQWEKINDYDYDYDYGLEGGATQITPRWRVGKEREVERTENRLDLIHRQMKI
jgi:hypothetical protein